MEYTIKQLARLAGISTRTLRYYDQIGLLCPKRVGTGDYRIYSEQEVDALHKILLYKSMGLELSQIKREMDCESLDFLGTLQSHLKHLQEKKNQLELMIDHVNRTIEQEKGLIIMTHEEKFQAMKEAIIADNEQSYGEETRVKYGDEAVDRSNKKLLDLKEEEYQQMEQTEQELLKTLAEAVTDGGDSKGETGRVVFELHRKWLQFTWQSYSSQAHAGLAEMYVCDPRFTAYYDKEAAGCAQFLRDSIIANI